LKERKKDRKCHPIILFLYFFFSPPLSIPQVVQKIKRCKIISLDDLVEGFAFNLSVDRCHRLLGFLKGPYFLTGRKKQKGEEGRRT